MNRITPPQLPLETMIVIAVVAGKRGGGLGKWYPGHGSNICPSNGSGSWWQWNRRSSHNGYRPRGGREPHLAGHVEEEGEAVELYTVLHSRPGYRAKHSCERVCRCPGDVDSDCLGAERGEGYSLHGCVQGRCS